MTNTKKLTLNNLKVSSFITKVNKSDLLKGGQRAFHVKASNDETFKDDCLPTDPPTGLFH